MPPEHIRLYSDKFEISEALEQRFGLREGSVLSLQMDRQNQDRVALVFDPDPENGHRLTRSGSRLVFSDLQASLGIRNLYNCLSAEQFFTLPAEGFTEGEVISYQLILFSPEAAPATT